MTRPKSHALGWACVCRSGKPHYGGAFIGTKGVTRARVRWLDDATKAPPDCGPHRIAQVVLAPAKEGK